MQLTYLGTAASECFPALFCNCEYCREARRLGGKNIRTRSQALINNDLLIDLPADTYWHFVQNGIEGDAIRYLLITHAHEDHFYKDDLFLRWGAYAHNMRAETLQVFCPKTVYDSFDGQFPPNVVIIPLEAFRTVTIGNYRVTPLPARHMPGAEAFLYLVEGDKTLLYAHDTGYLYDEVFTYIEQNGIRLDMATMDCTNVEIPLPDDGGHMGLPNIKRVIDRLQNMGAVGESTIVYVNHFSHNGNPLQTHLEELAAPYGYRVSYDGCCVEF